MRDASEPKGSIIVRCMIDLEEGDVRMARSPKGFDETIYRAE